MDQKVGSANDWVTMYDRNGDGMLDVSELQDLQTRLSKQMTDNIQLTKHLNTLETRSANHTTELKEKEVTLRKALEAMDYARTIQNELRSKLALSEQNHTMLSAEVSRLAGIERFCVFSSFRIYLCKLPSFPSFYCLLHFPAVDLSFFSNHLPLPLPWPLSHTFASLMVLWSTLASFVSFLFHAPLFVVNSLFVSFKKHVSKKQCLINVLVRNKETSSCCNQKTMSYLFLHLTP